jgi:hypothetical protein
MYSLILFTSIISANNVPKWEEYFSHVIVHVINDLWVRHEGIQNLIDG